MSKKWIMGQKWIAPTLLALLMTGCAAPTPPAIQAPAQQAAISQMSDIQWQPLELPSETEFSLNEQSPQWLNDRSAGAIAAFALPGDRGSITLTLDSFVSTDLQLYAPTMVIYNDAGKVLYHADFSQFHYEPAKLLDNDKFTLTVNLIPETTGGDMHVLITTTPDDLAGHSTVLHPAKAFALARHTQPPNIADPVVKHTPFGQFRLSVESNEVVSARLRTESNHNMPQGSDLTTYYHHAIKAAIDAGDVTKALNLLDEAKALDIQGAQAVFVEALNAQKTQ